MSDERRPDRGKLFANTQKQKPSQPDFHGDCTVDGVAYEIRGWSRNEQLAISLAPPRGDQNTYPRDAFRGALDPAPARGRGAHGADTPAWTGDIASEDAAFTVSAFEKQGKSGVYYTLSFERLERPERKPVPDLLDPDADDA